MLFLLFFWSKLGITHSPPLIPPKRGEADKRHEAVPAVYEKPTSFSILKIIHLENIT